MMKVGSDRNTVFLYRRVSNKSRVERHESLKQGVKRISKCDVMSLCCLCFKRAHADVLVLFLLFRESLIDKRIENAVSQMQSVIELGRVIRDRKTMPIKVS